MANNLRSTSWLRVRPRAVHNEPRAGTMDLYDDVRYRACLLNAEELCTIYDSSKDEPVPGLTVDININDPRASGGLNEQMVQTSREHFGVNGFAMPPHKSPVRRFAEMVLHPFHLMMFLAGALFLIAFGIEQRHPENLGLFFIVWAVAFLTCVIAQPPTPTRSLAEKFRKVRADRATVIRNGSEVVIPAEDVVPGDIMVLRPNDRVAADVRLLYTSGVFQLSEKTLTGSVQSVTKSPIQVHRIAAARKCENIVLQGSSVTMGDAIGVCVATGERTVLGRMYLIAGDKLIYEAPIHRDLSDMVRTLSIFGFILALIMFIIGAASDDTIWPHTLVFTAGVIVAAIPEGLLTTIIASLAFTSSRMEKHGLQVPDLETAETLGMVDTLCCDRTVFTSNRLVVGEVWYSGKATREFNINDPGFRTLTDTLAFSSTADWAENQHNLPIEKRDVNGDYIDAACLRFCDTQYAGIGETCSSLRHANFRVGEVPFLPRNNWMLHVRFNPDGQENRGYLKGAFERIRKMSDTILIDGEEVPMTKDHISSIRTEANTLAKKGFRILGLAQMVLPVHKYPASEDRDDTNSRAPFMNIDADDAEELFRDPDVRIVFTGLVGIDDPPKPGVAEAIKRCRGAGIKIVVTTGEHGWSTEHFGREVGLISGVTVENLVEKKFGWDTVQSWGYDEYLREENNLSGEEQQQITSRIIPGHIVEKWNPVNMDENWRRAIETEEVIFARCTPAQKKMIVDHYRLHGHVVGATGSDLHDCAAIKVADVGICCGQGIVDVTREVADVVSVDNSFIPIARGIEEGRLIFDNLKKSIAYCLTSNVPELAPFLLMAIIRLPLPMTASLALTVDLCTDIFPGLALAFEGGEGDIMQRPPPRHSDGVYNRNLFQWSYLQIGVIEALGALYTYFVAMSEEGYTPLQLWFRGWEFFTLDSAPLNGFSVQENMISLNRAQTSYFAAIVLIQFAVLMVARTRRVSLYTHGLGNFVVNLSVVISFTIALIVIYMPAVRDFFGATQIPFVYWTPALPWAVLVVEYDELRKLMIRSYGEGSVERCMVW
eukprot:PhM_4_TR5890/c0_g1_i1/m.67523/K01539/ATP1A; sodium/potassium-transporting ATPase subunit alpha